MIEYNYKAIDQDGNTVEGRISGENYSTAVSRLENRNLNPFHLERSDNNSSIDSNNSRNSSRNRYLTNSENAREKAKTNKTNSRSISSNKHRNTLLFTKQLANLLRSGIRLNEALEVITGIFRESAFRDHLIDIHHSLKEGRGFASSLEKYPGYFNTTYVSMVRAGEESGYLPLICERIVADMEENQRLRSHIITSMIYPIILLVFALLAVLTILLFILPKFIRIYESYDKDLPMPTLIMLNISNFISHNWLVLVLSIVLIIVLFWYYSRTENGRKNIDILKLRIPVMGKLLKKLAVSRITGGLGILVENGVPLLKSLKILKNVTGNTIYNEAMKEVAYRVERGSPLSQAMDSTGVFPDITVYLVGVGERTGDLGIMLNEVGRDMAQEYSEGLDRFLKFLEPAILLVLGGLIFFIVFAMILPVMRINTIL